MNILLYYTMSEYIIYQKNFEIEKLNLFRPDKAEFAVKRGEQ